jgi:pyocin large subunit-like protein
VAGYKIALSLGLALVLVAACERPSAVAKKEEPERASSASREASSSERTASADRSDEPVRELDGRPYWSSSRRGSAEENAQRAFDRNGEAFGADNVDDFVRKAHDFAQDPPSGTERLTRANGDVLLYDPKDNVFAVVSKAGAPRTMFKPEEGAAYWQEQKDREERRTAQAGRGDRESGDS